MTKNLEKVYQRFINGYVYVAKITRFFFNDLWHVIQGQQTLSARGVQFDMERTPREIRETLL